MTSLSPFPLPDLSDLGIHVINQLQLLITRIFQINHQMNMKTLFSYGTHYQQLELMLRYFQRLKIKNREVD
jgi:hypothetical protein